MTAPDTRQVPLWRLAHGRTGDKGDRSNISVIAYRPEFFDVLLEQVTEARVAELFAHRRPTSVKRYPLPALHAMNIVIDNVLDGGVNAALNLDAHGKSLAFLLLDLPVRITPRIAALLAEPDQPPPPAQETPCNPQSAP